MKIAISARGFVPDRISSLAAIAKETGISDIEVPVPAAWQERECHDLRRRMEREGLRPVVCATSLVCSPAAALLIAALDNTMRQARWLGTVLVNLYCGLEANQDPIPARIALAEALRLRVEFARRQNIIFTLENELAPPPNVAGTVPAWIEIAESVASPALRLTLDVANFFACNDTRFAAGQEAAWPLIGHVHCKDLAPFTPESAARFPYGQVFRVADKKLIAVPLGSGIVDHDSIIHALADHAYAGRLTIESFGDANGLRQSAGFIQQRSHACSS